MKRRTVQLQYANQPRFRKLRKWALRVIWIGVVCIVIVATPLAWLWWDWYSEQMVVQEIVRTGGGCNEIVIDVPVMSHLLPSKFKYLLYRVDMATVTTEAQIKDLHYFTRIKTLTLLSNDPITIEDAKCINQLIGLKGLGFKDPKIDDEDMEQLKGLTELEGLDLSSTAITDKGLGTVKQYSKLRWLNLDETVVTDMGLQQLKGLTALQDLYGTYRTRVTDKGISDLKKSLPSCTIH